MLTHGSCAIMGSMKDTRAWVSTSLTTLRVLRALVEDAAGPHYGLELIRSTGVRGGGLYPILNRLELDRWVVGEWESIDEAAAGRRRRRYYRLTGLGESEARAVLIDTVGVLALPSESASPGFRHVPGIAPA